MPRLDATVDLEGGGHLMVMEFLHPVTDDVAATFSKQLVSGSGEFEELLAIVTTVHQTARRDLPWCGPLDLNPSNVMAHADGSLVLTDPFFADGTVLYPLLRTDPVAVARAFPPDARRYMLELPLAWSGPWDEEERERMRRGLAQADEAIASAVGR
ncbi:MAG: hypothetical protein LKG20_11085 [Tetrasphaera jenkinsii]|nr:hypothetical protein [Tetrasphaera jenkinsii]